MYGEIALYGANNNNNNNNTNLTVPRRFVSPKMAPFNAQRVRVVGIGPSNPASAGPLWKKLKS